MLRGQAEPYSSKRKSLKTLMTVPLAKSSGMFGDNRL
jgi:hypothetical protein